VSATTLDADKGEVLDAPVGLDDFVGEAAEGAAHPRGIEQRRAPLSDSGGGSLRGLGRLR
jgi:hypothetical protein